jgi:UDP-N-acetylmuramoylalanine--D-glutamate ligase
MAGRKDRRPVLGPGDYFCPIHIDDAQVEMTMDLHHKKVLVVGLGKTGEALVYFLLGRGAKVKISEKKSSQEIGDQIRYWKSKGVDVETGGHTLASFLDADLIVPSPGVPPLEESATARKKGVPILSEIELAFRFLKGRIVGITGTNGKSTTATLLHKIMKEAGLPAYLAGNIGTPLISFVDSSREDHIYVTEISSFQLEYIERLRVPVSIFLNISRNHLDWHHTFDSYFRTKKRLVTAQQEGDVAILNRDDPAVWGLKAKGSFEVSGFSRKRKVRRGSFLDNGWIILRDDAEERLLPVSEIGLPGAHNQENVMAAAAAARLFRIPLPGMRASIKNFQGLEHRLEKVLTLGGVEFVNDSKATTVDATLKALESFDRKIVLILGGRDKGADFALLRKPVKAKVKKVILVGEAQEKIRKALLGTVPIEAARSIEEAAALGFASASPGEVVLLAPACTSWDMFKNFEERGEVFKREVRGLAKSLGQGKA